VSGPEPWLRADWPAPPRVRAFTTLRHGAGISQPPFDSFNLGLRCGDVPEHALANRAALIELAGLPSPPRWLRQVHGVRVCRFDDGPHPEPEADAAVTATPGTVLAIQTADCLPVLFCAPEGDEVAGAHAGWRGLAAGVLEAAVAAMRTSPRQLMAWLGPAAGPRAYEVGGDVHDVFVAQDAAAADAFTPTREGHWHVDLYALARQRLVDAGLAPKRVFGGGLCTLSDPQRFYSHRRDRRTGRMASLIWIRPE
jgi:hypothetical protein